MPQLYCPKCHWFGRYDERDRHMILCFEICPIALKEKKNIETKKNIENNIHVV
jgi:hypothetical protein